MLAINYVWREVEVVDEDGVAERRMAMVPSPRYAKLAGKQFAAGEEYALEEVAERDMKRHSHFFAAMNEAFKNLPENIAARWPTAEHFRKWVLCETGWHDEKEFDCETELQAKRLMTFIRTEDRYARIMRKGMKVIVQRAKSQSLSAMGAQDFYASKRDVLDYVSGLIGVSPSELSKNAGRSA